MHVLGQSSLEFPDSDPPLLRAEPWSLVRCANQSATVNIAPWEIELPSVTITLPTIVVHLPTFIVDIFVVLEPPAAAGSEAEGSSAKRPGPKPQVRTEFGEPRVEVIPGSVEVTPTRFHAVPVTEQVRPLSVTVDFDGLCLETHAEALDLRILGTVEKA